MGGALLFAQSFGQNGRQEIAKTRVRWAAASAGIEQAASRGSPGHILVQGHFGRGLKAGLTGPCLAFAPILGRIPVAIDRIGRVARCRSHPSIVNIQQQIDWTTQLIGYAEPTCPATFGRTRRRACHFGPSFSQRFRDRYVLRLFGCIRQTGRFGSHFFPTQAKTHTHKHTIIKKKRESETRALEHKQQLSTEAIVERLAQYRTIKTLFHRLASHRYLPHFSILFCFFF